jgi:hypothetical protein
LKTTFPTEICASFSSECTTLLPPTDKATTEVTNPWVTFCLPPTGTQYRSAIFYHTPEQQTIAEEVKKEVQEQHYSTTGIVTEISPATEFWQAEDYHQEYLLRNPGGYCNHRLRW